MNQERIGQFIYKCRKEKNLTQKDIADKLGITNKAVSKWEKGYSLPDYSLLIPLCNILDITINDLLNGEKTKTQNEENTINAIDYYNKKSSKQWKQTICLFLLIFVLLFSGIYMLTNFGRSKVYSISSDSSEYIIQGYLITNQKQNIITISNLEYDNKNNIYCVNSYFECNDDKYVRDIKIYLNDGKKRIATFHIDKGEKDVVLLNNLLKDVTIDLSENSKKINIKENDLKIIISYESAEYEKIKIELKLNLQEVYTNNKIFY